MDMDTLAILLLVMSVLNFTAFCLMLAYCYVLVRNTDKASAYSPSKAQQRAVAPSVMRSILRRDKNEKDNLKVISPTKRAQTTLDMEPQ